MTQSTQAPQSEDSASARGIRMLRTAMGTEIAAALADPDVVEILLNPDGTLWIARRFRNQLITLSPRGEAHKGPELPDPVYEVTQADRDRYLQAYPVEVRPKETDLAWAVVFPPFTAAFATRDGLWLEKTKQVLDSLRRIQVLDREGALRRVLVLHGQARLIAVGTDKLLLAEQFAKGVRLMEVRIPAAAPTP